MLPEERFTTQSQDMSPRTLLRTAAFARAHNARVTSFSNGPDGTDGSVEAQNRAPERAGTRVAAWAAELAAGRLQFTAGRQWQAMTDWIAALLRRYLNRFWTPFSGAYSLAYWKNRHTESTPEQNTGNGRIAPARLVVSSAAERLAVSHASRIFTSRSLQTDIRPAVLQDALKVSGRKSAVTRLGGADRLRGSDMPGRSNMLSGADMLGRASMLGASDMLGVIDHAPTSRLARRGLTREHRPEPLHMPLSYPAMPIVSWLGAAAPQPEPAPPLALPARFAFTSAPAPLPDTAFTMPPRRHAVPASGQAQSRFSPRPLRSSAFSRAPKSGLFHVPPSVPKGSEPPADPLEPLPPALRFVSSVGNRLSRSRFHSISQFKVRSYNMQASALRAEDFPQLLRYAPAQAFSERLRPTAFGVSYLKITLSPGFRLWTRPLLPQNVIPQRSTSTQPGGGEVAPVQALSRTELIEANLQQQGGTPSTRILSAFAAMAPAMNVSMLSSPDIIPALLRAGHAFTTFGRMTFALLHPNHKGVDYKNAGYKGIDQTGIDYQVIAQHLHLRSKVTPKATALAPGVTWKAAIDPTDRDTVLVPAFTGKLALLTFPLAVSATRFAAHFLEPSRSNKLVYTFIKNDVGTQQATPLRYNPDNSALPYIPSPLHNVAPVSYISVPLLRHIEFWAQQATPLQTFFTRYSFLQPGRIGADSASTGRLYFPDSSHERRSPESLKSPSPSEERAVGRGVDSNSPSLSEERAARRRVGVRYFLTPISRAVVRPQTAANAPRQADFARPTPSASLANIVAKYSAAILRVMRQAEAQNAPLDALTGLEQDTAAPQFAAWTRPTHTSQPDAVPSFSMASPWTRLASFARRLPLQRVQPELMTAASVRSVAPRFPAFRVAALPLLTFAPLALSVYAPSAAATPAGVKTPVFRYPGIKVFDDAGTSERQGARSAWEIIPPNSSPERLLLAGEGATLVLPSSERSFLVRREAFPAFVHRSGRMQGDMAGVLLAEPSSNRVEPFHFAKPFSPITEPADLAEPSSSKGAASNAPTPIIYLDRVLGRAKRLGVVSPAPSPSALAATSSPPTLTIAAFSLLKFAAHSVLGLASAALLPVTSAGAFTPADTNVSADTLDTPNLYPSRRYLLSRFAPAPLPGKEASISSAQRIGFPANEIAEKISTSDIRQTIVKNLQVANSAPLLQDHSPDAPGSADRFFDVEISPLINPPLRRAYNTNFRPETAHNSVMSPTSATLPQLSAVSHLSASAAIPAERGLYLTRLPSSERATYSAFLRERIAVKSEPESFGSIAAADFSGRMSSRFAVNIANTPFFLGGLSTPLLRYTTPNHFAAFAPSFANAASRKPGSRINPAYTSFNFLPVAMPVANRPLDAKLPATVSRAVPVRVGVNTPVILSSTGRLASDPLFLTVNRISIVRLQQEGLRQGVPAFTQDTALLREAWRVVARLEETADAEEAQVAADTALISRASQLHRAAPDWGYTVRQPEFTLPFRANVPVPFWTPASVGSNAPYSGYARIAEEAGFTYYKPGPEKAGFAENVSAADNFTADSITYEIPPVGYEALSATEVLRMALLRNSFASAHRSLAYQAWAYRPFLMPSLTEWETRTPAYSSRFEPEFLPVSLSDRPAPASFARPQLRPALPLRYSAEWQVSLLAAQARMRPIPLFTQRIAQQTMEGTSPQDRHKELLFPMPAARSDGPPASLNAEKQLPVARSFSFRSDPRQESLPARTALPLVSTDTPLAGTSMRLPAIASGENVSPLSSVKMSRVTASSSALSLVPLRDSPYELRSPESMKRIASPSPRLFWEKGLGVEGYQNRGDGIPDASYPPSAPRLETRVTREITPIQTTPPQTRTVRQMATARQSSTPLQTPLRLPQTRLTRKSGNVAVVPSFAPAVTGMPAASPLAARAPQQTLPIMTGSRADAKQSDALRVQRADSGTTAALMPDSKPSDTFQADGANEEQNTAAEINLLAHEVWSLLKRRLANEGERMGRY